MLVNKNPFPTVGSWTHASYKLFTNPRIIIKALQFLFRTFGCTNTGCQLCLSMEALYLPLLLQSRWLRVHQKASQRILSTPKRWQEVGELEDLRPHRTERKQIPASLTIDIKFIFYLSSLYGPEPSANNVRVHRGTTTLDTNRYKELDWSYPPSPLKC